jgi:hypothetical protein
MARLLVVVVLLGIVIYLAIRMIQRRGEGGSGRRLGGRPVAPDDDPKFLRDLDTQLWEQQQRERQHEEQDDPPAT